MRIFIGPFVLFCLISCDGEKAAPAPKETLEPGMFIQLLADFHVAEAYVRTQAIPADSAEKLLQAGRAGILERRRTHEAAFDSSLEYYSRNPTLMDSISREVINELSKRLAVEANR